MESILKNIESNSFIKNNEVLRPDCKKVSKKILFSAPLLTPLVDVFAILVIYLLVHSVDPNKLEPSNKNIQLPLASYANSVEAGFVISLYNGNIYIDDKRVSRKAMTAALSDYIEQNKNKQLRLTITGDKRTSFSTLSPIIETCSSLGLSDIQFAIVRRAKT